MPYKKKQAIPGTVQFNKLIAELPEKRQKIKAQIEFRNSIIESQKLIIRTNSIGYRVLKIVFLRHQCKNKIARTTEESKAIIKWITTSSYLFY